MHANHHGHIDLAEACLGFLAGFWLSSVFLALVDLVFFGGNAPLTLILPIAGCAGLASCVSLQAFQRHANWPASWDSDHERHRES